MYNEDSERLFPQDTNGNFPGCPHHPEVAIHIHQARLSLPCMPVQDVGLDPRCQSPPPINPARALQPLTPPLGSSDNHGACAQRPCRVALKTGAGGQGLLQFLSQNLRHSSVVPFHASERPSIQLPISTGSVSIRKRMANAWQTHGKRMANVFCVRLGARFWELIRSFVTRFLCDRVSHVFP